MSASSLADPVLAALRSAGPRGVAYIDLRRVLDGEGAEPVLDHLRALGHRIVRCPGDRGQPLAILTHDAGRLL